MEQLMKAIMKAYKDIVDNNHGIKEINLKDLFVPLCLDFDNLSPELIPTLNSYGSQRGGIAHKGLSTQIKLDLRDESNTIDNIIKYIEDSERFLA